MQSLAHPAHHPNGDTRELRALDLYRNHGADIRQIGQSTFSVPSQDGKRSYDVEYGQREVCSCADYLYGGHTCVHIYALAIAMAKGTLLHPELAAGDPFVAAAQDHPHACTNGIIYLGYTDDEGEEYIEALPCRRCSEAHS